MYLRCFLHHILSLIVYTFRENWEFVFMSIVQFTISANSRIRFGLPIVFVCLYITPSHYHHCANFIWRHWTDKTPVRYNLSSVWVRLSIFSQLSIIQYVGLYVLGWLREYTYIIIIKSEVWTITHCLGLGHETMVCAVCLSIFLWAKPVLDLGYGQVMDSIVCTIFIRTKYSDNGTLQRECRFWKKKW